MNGDLTRFLQKAQNDLEAAEVLLSNASVHITEALLKAEGDEFLHRRDRHKNATSRIYNLQSRVGRVRRDLEKLKK